MTREQDENAGHRPAALLLMGATCTGKTALSVMLARQLGGEIISVDSALVYRGMDIGTAKPTMEERDGIAHHLVDILDPAESYSVGSFVTDATRLVHEISGRGRLPLLVGGTMLYFNGLRHGMAELPEADASIRQQLDEQAARVGWVAMHARLAAVDPATAGRVHPNDPQRIQRALEVHMITGKPLSALQAESHAGQLSFDVHALIIEPADRASLHQRIATRFSEMLGQGLEEEVAGLYRRGDLHAGMPSIRSVGYRQLWSYLDGEYDYREMQQRGIIATRQLAKRQLTWLRREKQVTRYDWRQPGLAELIASDFRLGKLALKA